MSKAEDFLTRSEEAEVVAAIRTAEGRTSGEIRVHLENSHGEKDLFERAREVFHQLKMDNTKEENGVLIYVAVEDHEFVIYGDRGIYEIVPKDFWETTKDAIAAQFKKGNFKQGLIDGILMAGKELQEHFPWSPDTTNELPNTISKK